MFIDEAKLAAQLTHNNIIHIYDLGKEDAYHYIAMEYVEGKDLRSILKTATEKGYPLPVELALFIASKVANALDYAHRRLGLDGKELNLVHRDVSPQNVLISFEGDIKLCDFGIAKAATKVQQTQAGALKGKLQYMSPEQAWGKKVDRRTDIFSLGVVLYEMLTAERLFSGDTDLTILEQVRDARSEPPSVRNPDVPKRVDQIVLKALAKNPQDRYQNASEMEKDINSVLYSFQPAPGPADLAIFMHRLVEAAVAASDAQIDAAFAQVAAAPAPEKKKGKGLVISKKERAAEPAPVPEPVEVSQPAVIVAEEPGKSRTGLFAGIGVAAIALIAVAVVMTRGKAPAPAPVPAPAPTAVAAAPDPETAAEPEAPEKVIDPKVLEAELKKAAAAQEQKLREAAQGAAGEPARAATAPAATQPAAAPVSLAPSQPLQPPRPAQEPTRAPEPTPAPEPTAVPPRPTEPVRVVPTPAPAAPVAAAPAQPSAAVREGDLVGAGPGVVEARLVRLGKFPPLPAQARRVQSAVTVHALVDERGQVTETRVLRSSGNRIADDAAIAALKGGQVEPATKNGVRVKMYKTFTIDVRP
jgi:TonB family protein